MASGRVEELRDRGTSVPAVRVAVDGAPEDWLGALPGAEVMDRGATGVLVALRGGAGPNQLLDAARAAGSVRYFAHERPTLTELFRKAVAA